MPGSNEVSCTLLDVFVGAFRSTQVEFLFAAVFVVFRVILLSPKLNKEKSNALLHSLLFLTLAQAGYTVHCIE